MSITATTDSIAVFEQKLRVKQLEREIERLREALQYFVNNPHDGEDKVQWVERARAVLEQKP